MVWLVASGAVASIGTAAALVASVRLKRREGGRVLPLASFWGTATGYMLSFTALRAFDMAGFDQTLAWYYAQTLTGAATLISLVYILASILYGRRAGLPGAAVATVAAAVTVWLVLKDGQVFHVDAWTIEVLPNNTLGRSLVAAFYIAVPVLLSALAAPARDHPPAVRRRTRLFALSVVLMYVPNAIKYVVLTDGVLAPGLAATMAVGALIGWRAYTPEPA